MWKNLRRFKAPDIDDEQSQAEQLLPDLSLYDLPAIGNSRATSETACRIADLPFTKVEPPAGAAYTDMPAADLALQVRSLYRYYQTGTTVVRALDGVSFDVKVGEFCAIVGTSGSGKSTLLNQLAGLEPATAGIVRVFNRDIAALNERELVEFRLQNIGFIFQSFNLIKSLTALENVCLPLVFKGVNPSLRKKAATVLLQQLGLQNHAGHLPTQLSGGQQQRLGIARALIANPRIIYADEPTGNLDSKSAQETLKLLKKIAAAGNKTIIMVTHDEHLAQYADRIFKISDGKLVAVSRGTISDNVNKQ